MRQRLTIAAAALLALAVSGTALAAAPATPDQATAIAARLPAPEDCYAISVSTVDPAWAVASPRRGSTGCSSVSSDPAESFFFDVDRWVNEPGSHGLSSPVDPKTSCTFLDGARGTMPAAAALDLGVCVPAIPASRTTIQCVTQDRTRRPIRRRAKGLSVRKPKTCNTLTSTQSFAEAVDLVKLRWRRWGTDTATATGRLRAWHGEATRSGRIYWPTYRVSVTAHTPMEYGGKRWYTRLTIKGAGGPSTIELDEPKA